MRLVLVISSLSSGGAERVMAAMANFWIHKGHSITIITLDSKETDFYPLSHGIRRVGLGISRDSSSLWSALKNNFKRILKMREAIKRERAEILISFMEKTNVLVLVATLGLGIKKVIMEHTNPESHSIETIWRILRKATYRQADRLGILTERARPWAISMARRERVFVMPNPVSVPLNSSSGNLPDIQLPPNSFLICSMGRLSAEKGFDLLIGAFSQVNKRFPNTHLIILGEGAERPILEGLVDSLGLREKVQMPGRIPSPFSLLRKCHLFVMSSRYEGFPMALCEAMACGLPSISFDCPTGPSEIIRPGIDGILVPPGDVDKLAKTIIQLIPDEIRRNEMATHAPDVLERFSEKSIMAKWDQLLFEL